MDPVLVIFFLGIFCCLVLLCFEKKKKSKPFPREISPTSEERWKFVYITFIDEHRNTFEDVQKMHKELEPLVEEFIIVQTNKSFIDFKMKKPPFLNICLAKTKIINLDATSSIEIKTTQDLRNYIFQELERQIYSYSTKTMFAFGKKIERKYISDFSIQTPLGNKTKDFVIFRGRDIIQNNLGNFQEFIIHWVYDF
jgi:hypothetical protein